MGATTGISWTQSTWNPLRGCSKVSEGCTNCYAMSVASRFNGAGQPYEGLAKHVNGRPAWTNQIKLVPEHLEDPLRWQKPRMIFVNSMSDLFHPQVPIEFIARVFAVMALAPHHTFQVLTKRPERMQKVLTDRFFYEAVLHAADHEFRAKRPKLLGTPISDPTLYGLANVWLGTSVEDQASAETRIPHLLLTPAKVRFLSCEPLIGQVNLHEYLWEEAGPAWAGENPACPGLDWLIAGGESGQRHRLMDPDWARSLRDQCVAAQVPFFFKQYGGARSGGPCELDGREWHEFPAHLESETVAV